MSPDAAPLAGRTVVVTHSGATTGVVVRTLAAHGARVVFAVDPGDEQSALELVRQVTAGDLPGSATYVTADLTQERDIERLFDAATEDFAALDALVLGGEAAASPPLAEVSAAQWNTEVVDSLRSMFLVTQRATDEFLSAGNGGRIVQLAGLGGRAAGVFDAVCRSAMLGFGRSVAKEYGRRRITWNAVVRAGPSAGAPLDGDPLGAILFLLSDDSSFVNGDALYVSGDIPGR